MGSRYRIDPKQQFSKKLARWTAVFWFVQMLWLSVLMMIQPSVAVYSVYMSIIVTVVMVVNVWAYTRNSIYEKACLAVLDKARIGLSLTNAGKGGDDGNTEDSTGEESYG